MISLYENVELPKIEKVAVDTKVSSNTDNWVTEVHQDLLEQHPYLTAYSILQHMESVSAEDGFGVGAFIIRNKHALSHLGQGAEELSKKEGVRSVRVPIIINNYRLKPFDVLIDDKGIAYPLNESRFKELLFRPDLFDTTDQKTDTTTFDRIFLPSARMSESFSKMSSDGSAELILEKLGRSLSKDKMDRLHSVLSSDKTLLKAASADQTVSAFLRFLDEMPVTSTDELKKLATQTVSPNVVQVRRKNDNYIIKMANTETFSPVEGVFDYPDAVELVGKDLVHAANEAGVATVATEEPVVDQALEDVPGKEIEEFGAYRVKGSEDRIERVGWVFPDIRSFLGVRLPLKVFNNGDVCSIQENIVGSRVGHGVNLVRGPVEKQGMFYRITDSGSIIALEPVEIQHRFVDPNSDSLVFVISPLSSPLELFQVHMVPGMKTVVPLNEQATSFGLPADIRWMPLGEEVVPLITSQEGFAKLGSAQMRVEITGRNDTWSFEGPAVQKIATKLPIEKVGGAEAMFIATCLGMEPEFALTALTKAATDGETIRLGDCRPIVLAEEKERMAQVDVLGTVQKFAHFFPETPLLLKEAIHLSKAATSLNEQIQTVDKVLSIGFLSPANIKHFVNHLPDYETTVKHLADLLIAVRLGEKRVDEAATKKAMESLEKVIAGLRQLVHEQPRA